MIDEEFLEYKNERMETAEDGVIYIEDTTYRVFTDGTREVACSAKYSKPSDEPVQPEPTEAELVQAALLLNQAEIMAKQNEQDEVLAEILLSQLEV